MGIPPRDMLLVVYLTMLAYDSGVDCQFSKESHPLLASLFNVVNTAASRKPGQRSVVKDVKKKPDVIPPITIGTIAGDMACSVCRQKKDIKCMEIHCMNTELPGAKQVASLTPTNNIRQGSLGIGSQLDKQSNLSPNVPHGIIGQPQASVPFEPRPHNEVSTNIQGHNSSKLVHGLPLSWTQGKGSNNLNVVPPTISGGPIVVAPSQMTPNEHNVHKKDIFRPNKPHINDITGGSGVPHIDSVSNGQLIVDSQSFIPGKPIVPPKQPLVIKGSHFDTRASNPTQGTDRLNSLFAGQLNPDSQSQQTPFLPGQPIVPSGQSLGHQNANFDTSASMQVQAMERLNSLFAGQTNTGSQSQQIAFTPGKPIVLQDQLLLPQNTNFDQSGIHQNTAGQQVPKVENNLQPILPNQPTIENNMQLNQGIAISLPGGPIPLGVSTVDQPNQPPTNPGTSIFGTANERIPNPAFQPPVDSRLETNLTPISQGVPIDFIESADQTPTSLGDNTGVPTSLSDNPGIPLSAPHILLPGEANPNIGGINEQPTQTGGGVVENRVSETIREFFPDDSIGLNSASTSTNQNNAHQNTGARPVTNDIVIPSSSNANGGFGITPDSLNPQVVPETPSSTRREVFIRRPVDLNVLIHPPFDTVGQEQSLPERNIHFLDFGFGPIWTPHSNGPAAGQMIPIVNTGAINPAPIAVSNELPTHDSSTMGGGQGVPLGEININGVNIQPLAGSNNAPNMQSLPVGGIAVQSMNPVQMENIPLNDVNTIFNANEPLNIQPNNDISWPIGGVPLPNNDISSPIGGVPLPGTNPVAINNINNNQNANFNNNHNVNGQHDNNNQVQNVQFMDFSNGIGPDGAIEFTNININTGMELGGAALQTGLQEQVEPGTLLPTNPDHIAFSNELPIHGSSTMGSGQGVPLGMVNIDGVNIQPQTDANNAPLGGVPLPNNDVLLPIGGVPLPNNDVLLPIGGVPLPGTNPVDISNINNNQNANFNNNQNVNGERDINIPLQNMQFMDFSNGIGPDGGIEFANININTGMELGGASLQNGLQEQVETPTPLPTKSPRRQEALNRMTGLFLGNFNSRSNP